LKVLSAGRVASVLVLLAALLVACALAGVLLGPSGLAPGQVWDALRGGGSAAEADIVWRVRLPRVALAGLVGASLAVAGSLFQALLRNPLADPFVLGVSGGAAVGGTLALGFGAALGLGYAAVPPAAFAGALGSVLVLLAAAGASGRLSPTRLLLTGVVLNALASAVIIFLASLAGLAEGTGIFLWLIGNLSEARVDVAGWVGAFLAVGLGCALLLARPLNLLALGEEPALLLGVEVERVKRALLAATSLVVAAAVSVAGLIGFVGLIVPHLLRMLFGPDHRLLVPAAALGGAAFLIACDTLARIALPGRELPVGAITALAGGPLFLVLLRRPPRAGLLP
jgi:iron complex transport system permease protein